MESILDIIWKIVVPVIAAVVSAVVFLIRLEGRLKALTRQVEGLIEEYRSMIAEYKKLNELYMDIRTQVNINTKDIEALQKSIRGKDD